MAHRIVLILGSAPDALRCTTWPKPPNVQIVAINNAWRLRQDFDYVIAPDDFPVARRPNALNAGQTFVGSADYVPENNRFGGIFYAGGTMAFTAGYWALSRLKPTIMAFLGCDMVYPRQGKTHFYGTGSPDPLRKDPSLRSLEAKSARLMLHARLHGCACVRLSRGDSRLVFPSVAFDALQDLPLHPQRTASPLFVQAQNQERRLDHFAPDGRYWKVTKDVDVNALDAIDHLWLRAAG